MKKILYIYGLGSSPDSDTRKMLDEILSPHGFTVISVAYNQKLPKIGLAELNAAIEREKPIAVIASSLGGFFAMNLAAMVPVILINPCLKPATELPKLGEDGDVYKDMERLLFNTYKNCEFPVNHLEKMYGFFGTHDELFSYKDEFSKLFPAYDFDGGHRPTKENLQRIAPEILKKLPK